MQNPTILIELSFFSLSFPDFSHIWYNVDEI